MDNKTFEELLSEIKNMTPEQYNEYHKEALKMKKSFDKMIDALENVRKENQK